MTLHDKALRLAKEYKRAESELLEVLMRMHEGDLFLTLGYTGIFAYCVGALKLGEAQASYFARVARKAREVPALKTAIDEGKLTVSQARRIVPVLSQDNCSQWIEKAATLPQRQLEREVSAANPEAAVRETLRPVAVNRSVLRLGISQTLEDKLRRMKDLASQRFKKAASVEDVLELAVSEYLDRHDPVKKAERASARKANTLPLAKPGRRPIAAPVRHAVVRRDQERCTYRMPDGHRCEERRWLHLHHVTPVSRGGTNVPTNLTTLCSLHHRSHHRGEKGALPRRFPVFSS